MQKVLNVPNVLSIFRLLLIPVFVVLYFSNNLENHYWYAMGVVMLAGITDVVDGIIARKFNLITAVGKILDPLADKLMQAAVLVCLAITHPNVIVMAVIHIVKELTMLIGGAIFFRKQAKPYSSRWWGKMSTVIIMVTQAIIIFNDIIGVIPDPVILGCVIVSIASMIFAFVSYVVYGLQIRKTDVEGELVHD